MYACVQHSDSSTPFPLQKLHHAIIMTVIIQRACCLWSSTALSVTDTEIKCLINNKDINKSALKPSPQSGKPVYLSYPFSFIHPSEYYYYHLPRSDTANKQTCSVQRVWGNETAGAWCSEGGLIFRRARGCKWGLKHFCCCCCCDI